VDHEVVDDVPDDVVAVVGASVGTIRDIADHV
jgi:hypothetical protein